MKLGGADDILERPKAGDGDSDLDEFELEVRTHENISGTPVGYLVRVGTFCFIFTHSTDSFVHTEKGWVLREERLFQTCPRGS